MLCSQQLSLTQNDLTSKVLVLGNGGWLNSLLHIIWNAFTAKNWLSSWRGKWFDVLGRQSRLERFPTMKSFCRIQWYWFWLVSSPRPIPCTHNACEEWVWVTTLDFDKAAEKLIEPISPHQPVSILLSLDNFYGNLLHVVSICCYHSFTIFCPGMPLGPIQVCMHTEMCKVCIRGISL